jgi:RND family efflux transporter MFP subunit
MKAGWLPPLLASCAFAALLTGCDGSGDAQASPSPSASPVAVVAVATTTIHPTISMPGAIAPYESISLSNSIDEPTAEVYVQEGDRVRRGQVLAQLQVDDLEANLQSALSTAAADRAKAEQSQYTATLNIAQVPDQVRQARAQLIQAQATLIEAQKNLERDRSLLSQGYLPQINYDEQQVVVRNDQQAMLAAEAAVHSALVNQQVTGNGNSGLQAAQVEEARDEANAQEASADQIRRQIARARIVSPVDGIVTNRNLNPGEYPGGRQIFTIESNATVYGILTASAVQAYQIGPGDGVAIVRAGMPRGQFSGRVVAVLDATTAGSTNFTVKVAVPNRTGQLRAGTPVDATISLQAVTGLGVPDSAFTDDTHSHVLAVVDGRARTVNVTEVATDGRTSIVRGVSGGEQIVEDGDASLSDGQQVVASR